MSERRKLLWKNQEKHLEVNRDENPTSGSHIESYTNKILRMRRFLNEADVGSLKPRPEIARMALFLER